MDVGFEEIDSWHQQRGFKSPSGIHCGYHVIIKRCGMIEQGRPYHEVGAHCRGHNRNSLGICLVGGMDDSGKPDSNYTMAQLETLSILCADLDTEFPGIIFSGHRDYSNKACPVFDITAILSDR